MLTLIESAERLQAALQTLAARDTDFAREENGVGFSKMDGTLGHSLARQSAASWSARQYAAAYKIVRKYARTQVAIDFAVIVPPGDDVAPRSISQPTRPVAAATRNVAYDGTPTGVIVYTFAFDRGIIDALKAVGGRFNPAATNANKGRSNLSVWWALPNATNAVGAIALIGQGWGSTPETLAHLRRLAGGAPTPPDPITKVAADIATNDWESLPDPVCPNLREGFSLRPFQVTGAKFLMHFKRALCADDMGVGKTLQALAAADSLGAFPLLVVCPAVVKGNWLREIGKFFPSLTASYIGGDTSWHIREIDRTFYADNLNADIVIINYDILLRNKSLLMSRKWKAIIADEAHYLKSRDVQRTLAFKHIATGYDSATRVQTHEAIEYRWLLTGTPIMNRPSELISLVEILDYLRTRFGGYTKFVNRYCDPKRSRFGTDITGATNLDELANALRAGIMIRRSKRDVLKDLPAKSRVILTGDLTNTAEYVRAERDVVAFLSGIARDRADVIAQATADGIASGLTGDDLEAYVNAARDQAARDQARRARSAQVLVAYNTLRQLAGKGKVQAVIDWVTEFLETGKKLIVFATHHAVIAELARKFNAVTLTGNTDASDRTAIVDRFQIDPDFRLLVANTKAGGVGITLTAASDVLFTELEWNPAMHDQAEDRVNRMGQTEPCTAWYMLAPNTIDGDMYKIIDSKREVAHEAMGDGDHDRVDTSMMDSIFDGLMSRNR